MSVRVKNASRCYFEEYRMDRMTASSEGLGCRRGLNSHQFNRMSLGSGVGCHIQQPSHDREKERERLAMQCWLELSANVFFKKTGAGLSVAL